MSRPALARYALIVLLIALGLWIVSGFLPAFIWAVVIAVAIDPLVDRAERRFPNVPASVIALAFTAAFALLVLVPIGFGIAQGAREAHDVTVWIAQARHQGVPPPAWIANLPFGAAEITAWWQDHFSDPATATEYLDGLNHTVIATHGTLIGKGVLHRATIFGFTLLTLFFLVRDRDSIVAQCRAASAKLLGPAGERIGRQALLSVRGTIDGLVLVGIGVGAVMTVVYLVVGVPHPVLLGVFTALAAMIPFGPVLAFALAAFLMLTQGSVGGAIAVAVIGFAVEFVAGHFVRPALIGSATKLPFLWVLVGILGGVETLGLLGLFVGPATMAVLVMLWRELIAGKPGPVA